MALASPLAQSLGATAAAPTAIELAQMYYDDDDRRRDRRRSRRDRDGDSRRDGNSRGRGDGVYRGNPGNNQGTVFCNPQLGCVRDLNMTPGSGLGGR